MRHLLVWLTLALGCLSIAAAFLSTRLVGRDGRVVRPSDITFRATSSSSAAQSQEQHDNDNNSRCLELDENELGKSTSFQYKLEQLERLAKMTSTDPTAVKQAEELFEALETQDITIDAYNLLMEVYAFSPHEEGAEQAASILNRLKQHSTPRPNRESFSLVMDAWMRRGRLDKVEELLQDMKDSDDSNLQPNIYIYNKVIKARGMAGKPELARAMLEELLEATTGEQQDDNNLSQENEEEALLDKMHNLSIRPNHKTWVQVMRAYASPSQAQAGVSKIEELMGRMMRGFRSGQEDWKPDIESFNVLLCAYSHCKGSAKEAERILYNLIEQYRDGQEEMCPTNDSFYYVLRAYQTVNDASVPFKVEKLLQLQDGLAQAAGKQQSSLRPTLKELSAAMVAISRSRDSTKAVKAQRILERIKQEVEAGTTGFTPSVFPYKSVLNACAYTNGSPQDKLRAFQIAVDTFNEIRESPALQIDSSIFALFLRACAYLMPPTKKRDAVVEKVFGKCCQDGYVNDNVLREFRNVASNELAQKILGRFPEDGMQPPSDWCRNAAVTE